MNPGLRRSLAANPYTIWQCASGHLWRKADTEDCPMCAAIAREKALAEALRERECLCTLTHPLICGRCAALRQHEEDTR